MENKSTIVRSNISGSHHPLVRAVVSRAAALSPHWTARIAERLFLRPTHARVRRSALHVLDRGEIRFVPFRWGRIATWTWGRRGPEVWLAHGWGGHAGQFAALAGTLEAQGFTVVAFDQPAHGRSGGDVSALPIFAETLHHLAFHRGAPAAIIAHSMAAPAVAMAMSEGLRVERAVFVAPPVDLTAESRRYARAIELPEHVRAEMQRRIEDRFGTRWADWNLLDLAPRMQHPVLVVHDRNDERVPCRAGADLASAWPGARWMMTEGLGHTRILSDTAVLHEVRRFLAPLFAAQAPSSSTSAHATLAA